LEGWIYNWDKMFGILKREYNIARDEALFDYTWEELQDLIASIPPERITNLTGGNEREMKVRYLEAFCDREELNEAAFSRVDALLEKLKRK
jgi:hypothetical protein